MDRGTQPEPWSAKSGKITGIILQGSMGHIHTTMVGKKVR